MRRLQRTIGTMTLLLLGVAVVAAQAEPQFAGSWVLDRSQSQFPTHEGRGHGAPSPQAQPAQVTLMVEQHGNTLKVTRTMTMGSRERSMTDTLVTDGSDQTHQGYRGNVVTRAAFEGDRLVVTRTHVKGYRGNVVTRAAFEGDRLVVTRTHVKKDDQSDQTMSRQSIWTLSPDGRVLTIDTTFHSRRGDRAMKIVYQRS